MEEKRGSAAQGYLALAIGTALATAFAWASLREFAGGGAAPAREPVFLVLCGAWLVYAGVRLSRIGHRGLGATSLLALAAGALGLRRIAAGGGPGRDASYAITAGALLWFLLLTAMLLVLSWRASRGTGRPTGS